MEYYHSKYYNFYFPGKQSGTDFQNRESSLLLNHTISFFTPVPSAPLINSEPNRFPHSLPCLKCQWQNNLCTLKQGVTIMLFSDFCPSLFTFLVNVAGKDMPNFGLFPLCHSNFKWALENEFGDV